MDPQTFIETHTGAVLRNSRRGLLPSVFMAQMALESAFGKSTLAARYNNYFGIKQGTEWAGPVVNLQTNEVFNGQPTSQNDYFRVYESPEDSISDRASLLIDNSRYQGVLTAETPEAQAQALQGAGYATDPHYASKIIQIIDQYDLKELDKKKSK